MNVFHKKTKIVCTIGPACRDKNTLKRLVQSGMNCARLNFSHGTYDEHEQIYHNIRQVEKELNIPITIIQDLQGPKIRIGHLEKDRVLEIGEEIILSNDKKPIKEAIPISYSEFHKDVRIGEHIYLCDGAITLQVLRKAGKNIYCSVRNNGTISSHKGVNLPETKVSSPSVTKKDLKDLAFGLKLSVDYIAISFVRNPDDVMLVKNTIKGSGKDVPVIAKIEKPEAVKNIKEIINNADAVMVARGDLGIELPVSQVPHIQKDIIKQCNLLGKPVITATQMLETMILNPTPTRAEVSDVANAVLDGTSAVMLSGETAVGHYPVKTVRLMTRIIRETEKHVDYNKIDRRKIASYTFSDADAIAHASVTVAEDTHAKAIVPFTISGSTAMLISKYRPNMPVVALTSDGESYRRMMLYWNVYPLITKEVDTTERMITIASDIICNYLSIKKEERIVIVAGVPIKTPGITNLIKLQTIAK